MQKDQNLLPNPLIERMQRASEQMDSPVSELEYLLRETV
jgi:hypothetical protein